MSLILQTLCISSRFLNRIHYNPLRFGLGILLMVGAFEVLAAPAYLYNISTRCHIQSSTAKAVAGFVIEGGSKTVLIRGFGRGLGFSTTLDVEMTLIRQSDKKTVGYNNDWQNSARAGEIPTNQQLPHPTDAALLVTLPAGAYTVQVEPRGASGVGLVGVNDMDNPETSTSRLINISTRCSVEKSEKNAIAGFIIQGEGKLGVMIRAFGSGLGFSPQLDTQMNLVDLSSNAIIANNDNWQQHANADYIPAQYQLPDSSDAGLLLELSAGTYTAQVKPTGTIGIGLVGVNTANIETSPLPSDSDEPVTYQGMLTAHNRWRQQVGISNNLVWSSEAAVVAQAWADDLKSRGCISEHNPNRGNYGENIYWSFNLSPTSRDVVDAWGSEIADYDYATNTCATDKVCGHYTQVVWNDTEKVGCGKAFCNAEQIWVCNYSPPGNWVGQKPY